MKNATIAIVVSLAFHITLATLIALAFVKRDCQNNYESVRLDLSKMDFSLSSEDNDMQHAAADPLPQIPAREPPPPPSTPTDQPAEAPQAQSTRALPENPIVPEPEETCCMTETTTLPTPATRQARINAPPRQLSNIKPEYPAAARERGEQGEVTVEIAVAADGTVSEATTAESSGFAALDDAAIKAVRRAKFLPAKADGRPIAGRVRLKLLFRLKNR